MLFSSLSFIFRFLPVFLIIYYIVPPKLKNPVLFLGSLVFYALGEPVYVFLMLISILVNYVAARLMKGVEGVLEKRLLLIFALVFDLGTLLFFKYGAFFTGAINDLTGNDFFFPELALPLGISFYTFQILSYVIDVYRGEVECEENFIDLGVYIAMFPQLIAGPIVIYKDVIKNIKAPESRISFRALDDGLRLFTIGLASKVLIANRMGQLWDTLAEMGYANASFKTAWIGVAAYTLQIYFDFNGYSLMAIGLGSMLGFKLPKNFDTPYAAVSVTDFWKRWHMTLTGFFRNYLYIPMGGNRKGKLRMYLNLFIVWLLTGFWHGADWNFIIWGLYYFVFISIERLLFNKNDGLLLGVKNREWPKAVKIIVRILGHFYAVFVAAVGWAVFAVTDLSDLSAFMKRMFAPILGQPLGGIEMSSFSWVMYAWLLVGALFSSTFFSKQYEKIRYKIPATIILFVLFWLSVVQLTDSVYNPFLYFRF